MGIDKNVILCYTSLIKISGGKIVDIYRRLIYSQFNFFTMTGTIKTLVTEKNFGFITPEDGSKDIFFHATALNGVQFSELRQGDAVSFDVEDSEKGPRAANVVRA